MNSLLAEQVTLDQAAELMAVSSRHARRMLTARICAIYDRSESRPSSRLSCRSMPSHAGMLKLGKGGKGTKCDTVRFANQVEKSLQACASITVDATPPGRGGSRRGVAA